MKHRNPRRSAAIGLASAAVLAGALVATLPADAQQGRAPQPAQTEVQAAPQVKGSSAIKVSTLTPDQGSRKVSAKASSNAYCEVGEICFYWNSAAQGWGSFYDTAHNDPNLKNNHFVSTAAGKGNQVGNYTRGVWNRDPYVYAYICTGSGYTGCGWVAPNTYGTLVSPYFDNVESVYWNDASN